MIKRKLKCHCKKIVIEVTTPEKISNLIKCNCSLCSKKNALMAITEPENFKIVEGENFLKKYQFHSNTANHYFCSICGIYTHHNPRKDPKLFGFNIMCLENREGLNEKEIKMIDGKNHPLDKK